MDNNKTTSNTNDCICSYLQSSEGSHNVNGLNTNYKGGELLEELMVLKELKFSVSLLQETNKNWGQIRVYNRIKRSENKVWSKNKFTTSNDPERTNTEFQPGGTAMLIMDKWVSHICNSGRNTLG
eukprot:14223023-Ditylum_brightwellii.AAC.1